MRFLSATALLIAVLMLVTVPVRADGRFLSAIEDMPLAPGLSEIANSDVVFETAGSRIVEVSAGGSVTSADILSFYRRTLPQLGWTAAGKNGSEWRRDRELLSLDIRNEGGGAVVTYRLAPAK